MIPARRVVSLFFFVTIAVGGFAMIMTLPFDDLVAGSDVIAIASLKSSQEVGKNAMDMTEVENILTVSEVLKGKVTAGEEITVKTLSGFEDQVVFRPRQKCVVFLIKDPANGIFTMNNFVQGCWPLTDKNEPKGMGTGISLEKIKEAVVRTKDYKPPVASAPEPQF